MSISYRIERFAKNFLALRERRRIESAHHIQTSIDIPLDFMRAGEVIKAYGTEINNLVDVGAHKGFFTAAMQRFWRFDKTICVEPNRTVHDTLRKRVGPKVEIIDSALGSRNESTVFYVHPDSSMNSLIPVDPKVFKNKFEFYSSEEVTKTTVGVRTLDSLIEHFPDQEKRDILLKLDTQGNEIDVLQGGQSFLKRVSFAVVEWMFWGGYQNRFSLRDLIDLMEEQEFNCVGVFEPKYRSSGQVAYVDFYFAHKNLR